MTQSIDMDLLRKIISESETQEPPEATAQLIHDLLMEEFNVQHLLRPHRILTKLTELLDNYKRE